MSSPGTCGGGVLVPGTYIFEAGPAGSHPQIVRVSNSNDKVMFLGFTQIGHRPFNAPANQVIVLGETQPGRPLPIMAWYPVGTSTIHEFRW